MRGKRRATVAAVLGSLLLEQYATATGEKREVTCRRLSDEGIILPQAICASCDASPICALVG